MYQPFTVWTFKRTSRITFNKTSTNAALKHFKRRAIAELGYQFTFDEDQEIMETQPVYLSSDEN